MILLQSPSTKEAEGNEMTKVLLSLQNGTVTIFDLQKQSIEFTTQAGHSETIFDMEYFKGPQNYLASCSYDGTVRVWDPNTMKLLHICDTNFNSQQSKREKKIIYSISWHPELPIFAASTINGNCLIYHATRCKQLGHITPIIGQPSYRVVWNQINPEFLLMSSAKGKIYQIQIEDIPTCKSLVITREYSHNESIFGLCWNPFKETEFVAKHAEIAKVTHQIFQ